MTWSRSRERPGNELVLVGCAGGAAYGLDMLMLDYHGGAAEVGCNVEVVGQRGTRWSLR